MEIGHPLPALQLQNQENTLVPLADFKGKKLAIYFYPKDDTPGCTTQACSIRDGVASLLEKGITVIGISADTVASHLKFVQKHHLNFTLLSDPDKLAITQFGVWGPKKFMGKTYDGIHRKTFLFNEEGSLVHVIEKPNTKIHSEEIINFFNKAE